MQPSPLHGDAPDRIAPVAPPAPAVLPVLPPDLVRAARGAVSLLHASEDPSLVAAVAVALDSARRAHDPAQTGVPRLTISKAKLRRVHAFVANNLHGKITLAQMAAAAGLSRSHFCRCFHRTTGSTPQDFVRKTRVAAAIRMMLETDAPLAQVASATGFASQAHFTTVFCGVVGTTPGRWRMTARRPDAA